MTVQLINRHRYTLTYTPSADRILPAPSHLHVKIKNTSAIPLRAAYLHGPYTLYVSCYPAHFDPNKKQENYEEEGVPDFEPNLKAGGHWDSKLNIPQEIRDAAGSIISSQGSDRSSRRVTWIIEVTSQVVFSTSATVNFEILVGRDERSVDLGFYPTGGTGHGAPGKLEDHINLRANKSAQTKGIYSKSVQLAVDDTTSLWNSPAFPRWKDDEDGEATGQTKEEAIDERDDKQQKQERPTRKQQKVHLVIVTHGIHSNVGADLLFLKESIDATAKQAGEDARIRRAQMRAGKIGREQAGEEGGRSISTPERGVAPSPDSCGDDEEEEEEEDDEGEQVIVRGFGENVVRTERGIQYLGKRLAKYVLSITHPHQPYLPVKSSISKSIARSLTGQKSARGDCKPVHKSSSVKKDEEADGDRLAYRITSISFVGHSLGGLTQTYAIAYIQKHSPTFFDLIKPINFIALATPFLGLSNENPIYVKFALDFGLVGRTGQDLGLTWRAPTMVRSGWGAMIGGLGGDGQKKNTVPDPGAKPLLRVLPTGPAHSALKLFRNRSVYSNVVNDGIVPLRTSCLLFLDWRGLGRVEKARRGNGIVGTMVGWGWAEMMGQNASSPKPSRPWADFFSDSGEESDARRKGRPMEQKMEQKMDHLQKMDVPQPDEEAMNEDNVSVHDMSIDPKPNQFFALKPLGDDYYDGQKGKQASTQSASSPWSGLLSLFKPQGLPKPQNQPAKSSKIYHRGQTTSFSPNTDSDAADTRTPLVRGPSLYTKEAAREVEAPPRTSFFEAAGDVLKPPLPSQEFIIDPSARPRTIFHDRIYHPQDIPPPAVKQTRSLAKRSISRESIPKPSPSTASPLPNTNPANSHPISTTTSESPDMKIEEKIARAYHRDLSWRKVLVRLEPDAHNNMIVRRMFANAYGWPVIQHLCDTHFALTASATTADALEGNYERARPPRAEHGTADQVHGQLDRPDEREDEDRGREGGASRDAAGTAPLSQILGRRDPASLKPVPGRTASEIREATDTVPDLAINVLVLGPATAASTAADHPNSHHNGTGSLFPASPAPSSPPPSHQHAHLSRQDSARWSDRFFDGSDDDADDDDGLISPASFAASSAGLVSGRRSRDGVLAGGTSPEEIARFLALADPATTGGTGTGTGTAPDGGEGEGVEDSGGG